MDDEFINNVPQDDVEMHVQRILAEIEDAAPEVQLTICSRLLAALAVKLPQTLAGKVISAAKEPINSGSKKKATSTKSKSRASKGEEFARIDSQLGLLSDPTDPILAWNHFGGSALSVSDVLRQEPLGALEAMLKHDRMPPGPKPRGKTRQAIVDNIVQRLEAFFSAD